MQPKNEDHFKSLGGKWVESAYNGDTPSIAVDRLQCALDLVREFKPKAVLDVGCGDGRFLSSLPQVDRRVGLDHSEEMLSLARKGAADGQIEFATFDFNEPQLLSKFGRFDLITMLGVIHYLTNPVSAVQNIRTACSGYLAITFRNRLFNLADGSSYRSTPDTIRDETYLSEERDFWQGYANKELRIDSERKARILSDDRHVGFTDPGWNPHGLRYWRQFSPAEAIVLLDAVGFRTLRLIELNVVREQGDNRSYRMLPECTSFMIVAH
jgi:SAM-dependent methyltransferase